MSSKSAVKLIVGSGAESKLFHWASILTGSKNALKGVGFFVGGLLLYQFDFRTSLFILAGLVSIALVVAATLMRGDLGSPNKKVKFRQIFSNNPSVNVLAAARVFLFAARDVWFVVGLPVFLYSVLGWNFWQVGGFMAVWIMGYGLVQASTPQIMRRLYRASGETPEGRTATWLALLLALLPAAIAMALSTGIDPGWSVVVGLIAFGVVFALNSSVHSYLILAYSDRDKVAMNVGFYYMANAGGRLAGTILSGVLYQYGGLVGCLWASAVLAAIAGIVSRGLPSTPPARIPLAAVRGEE